MGSIEILLLALFVAVAALGSLARVLSIPYPILFMIGGLAIGAVPGLTEVELEPDLVLVLFLPPLLYEAAFFASVRELRADARAVSLLAIGLVLATTLAVGVAAHEVIGIPWAAAFVLGAVVSPTDPVAATTVFRRLDVSRRTGTILEGEGLINDATALVTLRVAVGAAVGGSFSLLDAGLEFVVGAVGGVAVGLAVAWVIGQIRRRVDDPGLDVTLSLFTGYAAYIPADAVEFSGVIAAVTAGLALNVHSHTLASADSRIRTYSLWETLTFLVNAVLFLLVGLQLPGLLDGLAGRSPLTVAGYALLVCATVIGLRMVWVFGVTALIRGLDRRPGRRERRAPVSERFLIAWSGLRGAVSLAAALSIPTQVEGGAPFPERDLIVFLAYTVIFATLVVQGLSLPALIARLDVHEEEDDEEEQLARERSTAAALQRLDELAGEEWTRDESVERLRSFYDYRRRRLEARASEDGGDGGGFETHSGAYEQLRHAVITAQRETIIGLRDDGHISNDVMHRLERELDLEEARLEL